MSASCKSSISLCKPDGVQFLRVVSFLLCGVGRNSRSHALFSGMSVCPARESGARPRAILNFEPVQPLVMRVLIVEDDNALADGLIRTLRQSGYP